MVGLDLMFSNGGRCSVVTVILVSALVLCVESRRRGDQNEARWRESTVFSMAANRVDPPLEKVWLFAVDGRKRPYSFLDADGNLVGFDVDLITKVCSVLQKRCKMVLAEFTECAFTVREITYAGRGLMSGWFDACPGYAISLDREGAFDFTEPYLDTDSSFTVAPGNPSDFDPDTSDFSQFAFAHLTGAVTNAACLARLNKTAGSITVARDLPEAKALLLNGTVDVLFSPRNVINGLEVLPARVRCDAGGAAIMLKKGSDLAQWWNPAFKTLVMSGEYATLCRAAAVKYNATVRCMDKPISNGASPLRYDEVAEVADSKNWLFSVSGHRKPFNYLDEQGRLTGFDIDFVQQVCQVAGRQCISVLSQFTECTFTDRNIVYPGRGLMEGWFDACTGYSNTLDRQSAFDFSDAYLRSGAFFTVAPGNPAGFDPSLDDFSNFTFTQLTGAYTNAKCLSRLGKKFGTIIIAANLPEAKALILSRQADVLFAPRSSIPDLETLPLEVHCEMTGTSMMVKRGSPLPDWWNPAFQQLVQTGQWGEFCQSSRLKYNHTIDCLDEHVS